MTAVLNGMRTFRECLAPPYPTFGFPNRLHPVFGRPQQTEYDFGVTAVQPAAFEANGQTDFSFSAIRDLASIIAACQDQDGEKTNPNA